MALVVQNSLYPNAYPCLDLKTQAVTIGVLQAGVTVESDSDDGYETPPEELHCVAPKDEESVLTKVQKQLEFYFSDENLQRDAFMVKHISRNRDGFVSLKLVASLRKVKAASKDIEVIKQAIGNSETLVLNADRTKVRRLAPLPRVDYSVCIRSVYVGNVTETTTSEQIQSEFEQFGEISRVRLFQPKRAIPLEIKAYSKFHTGIGQSTFAVVEYKNSKAVDEAIRKGHTLFNVERLVGGGPTSGSDSASWRRPVSPPRNKPSDGGEHSSSSENESATPKVRKNQVDARNTRKQVQKKKQTNTSFLSVSHSARDSDSGCSHHFSSSPSPSPEPLRRLRLLQSIEQSTVTIIRQPRGPDGSKGFKF